jgi:SAM-dependent methyltransferase
LRKPEAHRGIEPPSPWVVRFLPLAAADGAVLDLACGTGRHARLALAAGRTVVAVDRYNAGIVDLLGRPDFEFVDADLEGPAGWPLGGRRFAAVVVANYLHRPLLPAIVGAVATGGVLIYETFAAGNERFGRPTNPAFLLEPGELLKAVDGRLAVVAYEHGMLESPRRAVVQRLCAVDATGPYSAARRLDGGE